MGGFNILLGSKSKIKQESVVKAFGSELSSLQTIDSVSGVPLQPVGKEETQLGAYNRAIYAIKNTNECNKKFDFAIGIENGMWIDDASSDEIWVDGACLCAIPREWQGTYDSIELSCTSSSQPIFMWSDTVVIPPIESRPFSAGLNGEWSVLKDPHIILTNGVKSRAQFLEEALLKMIPQMKIST
jgi:hypothetical protein